MKKRQAEISARMQEIQALEEEDFNSEIVAEIEELSNEFEDIGGKIEAKEKLLKFQNVAKPARKTEAPASQPVARKAGSFETHGDFLMAVRTNALTGKQDDRFKNTMTTGVDAEGGFLVPEEFLAGVTKRLNSDDSLLALTTNFKVSSNNLTLHIDESTPWSGGVQASWLGETVKYTETTPNTLKEVSFKLHKLGVLISISEELLNDAVALQSYIEGMAPEAIVHKVNEAIVSGNGVAKPTGILNSAYRVAVAKLNAQSAKTIVAENVIEMYTRMLPKSRAKAVWLIHAGAEYQLRTMKDENDNYIYLSAGSQMNNSPYATLLGRPVVPMMSVLPELGTEGDIVFVDFSHYYSVLKTNGGIKQAVSTHLKFDQDLSVFKYTLRVDGKVPFSAPHTTQYGAHDMSGIVTLATRA